MLVKEDKVTNQSDQISLTGEIGFYIVSVGGLYKILKLSVPPSVTL